MLKSLKTQVASLLSITLWSLPASATCFTYDENMRPKASLCMNDNCNEILLNDYCGNIWGYSASYSSEFGKIVSICENKETEGTDELVMNCKLLLNNENVLISNTSINCKNSSGLTGEGEPCTYLSQFLSKD